MTHSPPFDAVDAFREVVCLVDDDAEFRRLVRLWLLEAGYEVCEHDRAESFLESLRDGDVPSVVLLDLSLPGLHGEDALAAARLTHQALPVVVLTATKDVGTMLSIVARGASDYMTKPVDRERLVTTVANVLERGRLSARVAALEHASALRRLPGVVGQSPEMRMLTLQVDRIADSDVSVLIHGESGTGKELIAGAIHQRSARAAGPFVALNCAAIPESLQDTELFGHERGSFTGASARRIGRFERAHGGTLLLDEIAELSGAVQSRLLRVLQERKLHRVGGGDEVAVDFRLLAASHKRLWTEVKRGRFREDLYFRLAVYELDVPPLRARTGDVPVLVQHFLETYGPQLRGEVPVVPPEAMAVLSRYHWPGNVRELQNAVQRAIVSCSGGTILLSDLPPSVMRLPDEPEPASTPRFATHRLVLEPGLSLAEIERRAIEWAIARADGNVSQAARELGIARTTLYRKLKSYDPVVE